MNKFNLILQLRRATKKVILLRKIIDSIPAISRFDSFVDQYSRVMIECNKVSKLLLNEARQELNLVCDLRCTPPTYGDFSAFLMAARILSSRFEVTFIMVIDELRSDWKERSHEDKLNLISDFKDLVNSSLVNHIVDFRAVSSFSDLQHLIVESNTIFFDFVSRRKKIYWDLKLLNNLLYKKLGCDPRVLLDCLDYAKLNEEHPKRYALWHVRAESLWAKDDDLGDEEILSTYNLLRRVLGAEIQVIVCGNERALCKIMSLAKQFQLDIVSAREYSGNFLGDLALLGGCKFFFQFGGGGFAEFAWSSSVPFFIASYPYSYRTFREISRIQQTNNQVTSWQTANQVFLLKTNKSKVDLESELKKFCSNLGVVN